MDFHDIDRPHMDLCLLYTDVLPLSLINREKNNSHLETHPMKMLQFI